MKNEKPRKKNEPHKKNTNPDITRLDVNVGKMIEVLQAETKRHFLDFKNELTRYQAELDKYYGKQPKKVGKNDSVKHTIPEEEKVYTPDNYKKWVDKELRKVNKEIEKIFKEADTLLKLHRSQLDKAIWEDILSIVKELKETDLKEIKQDVKDLRGIKQNEFPNLPKKIFDFFNMKKKEKGDYKHKPVSALFGKKEKWKKEKWWRKRQNWRNIGGITVTIIGIALIIGGIILIIKGCSAV